MQTLRVLLVLASVVCFAACSSPNPVVDAGVDAPTPTVDAGHDAASLPDTGPVPDVGTDAFVAPDTNVDAAVDCSPHTFVVTSNGISYAIDGALANPTITLCQGVTYMFDMTAVSTLHPMGLYETVPSVGATPLAGFPGGVVTSYTPMTAPLPTVYRCSVHFFGGDVVIH